MNKRGFTLIELMIVISITAVIVVTVTGLFFRAIRGGTKTETTVDLSQNAEFSMSLMERFIRNAKEVNNVGGVECPGIGSTITLIGWDGGSTQFSLSNGRIASNSFALSGTSVLIENLQFECIREEGVPDQVLIEFDATSSDVGGASGSSGHYESTVSLRNFQ